MQKCQLQAILTFAIAGACRITSASLAQTAISYQSSPARSPNSPPDFKSGFERSQFRAESACPRTWTLLQNP
jgi:hypothetical protein